MLFLSKREKKAQLKLFHGAIFEICRNNDTTRWKKLRRRRKKRFQCNIYTKIQAKFLSKCISIILNADMSVVKITAVKSRFIEVVSTTDYFADRMQK